MSIKKRVIVEKRTMPMEKAVSQFRVVRTVNTLSPEVGDCLSPDALQSLINDGVEVVIDEPRNRRKHGDPTHPQGGRGR